MQNLSSDQLRFVTLSQVSSKTSLGKSTIALWEAEGRFPKAVRLCRTKRVWLESDIDSWMLNHYQQNNESTTTVPLITQANNRS